MLKIPGHHPRRAGAPNPGLQTVGWGAPSDVGDFPIEFKRYSVVLCVYPTPHLFHYTYLALVPHAAR